MSKFGGMFVWFPVALALALAGCDPCTGIGACGGPYVRFEGEVLTKYPTGPAESVWVKFVRTGGQILEEDTLRALSDAEGRFVLEGTAAGEGGIVGDLIFIPPSPIPSVRVPGVRLSTTRTAGDRQFGGSWSVPFPHLPYEAHFFTLGTRTPVVGMEVEFRRTGGIRVNPDTFRVTTDFAGNIKLRPLTREIGELVGDLVVYPIPPYKPFVVPVRLGTSMVQRFDSTVVNVGIGRNLPYAGVLVWEDTGLPARGFEIEFRRTAGVPIQPDRYITVPDTFGTFHVAPYPLASGFVDGQLVIRSPEAYEGFVLRTLHLPVYESDIIIQNMGYFWVPRIPPKK